MWHARSVGERLPPQGGIDIEEFLELAELGISPEGVSLARRYEDGALDAVCYELFHRSAADVAAAVRRDPVRLLKRMLDASFEDTKLLTKLLDRNEEIPKPIQVQQFTAEEVAEAKERARKALADRIPQ